MTSAFSSNGLRSTCTRKNICTKNGSKTMTRISWSSHCAEGTGLRASASVHVFGKLSVLEEHKISRQITKATTTVVSEGYIASEGLLSSVMRANALSLARAAVDAANDAAALEDLLSIFSLEKEVLRLERARLSSTDTQTSSQELDYRDQENRKTSFHKALQEAEERLPSSAEEELDHAQTSGRTTEVVVVKSNRRSERMKKRERAQKKVDNLASLRLETEKPSLDSDVESLVREIRKKRLLTAGEEVKLAKGVQELLKIEQAKSTFIERMHREPTVQEWAKAAGIQERLFQKRLLTGRMCKDKMVSCNLGLVATIAKTYRAYGLPLEDLVQEGCMGLIRGIEKFDPSKGFKLSTYAYWWIKQAIAKAVAIKAKTVRLPVHYYDSISRIKRARRAIYEKYGRPADDKEVAAIVGITVSRMHALMTWTRGVRSFDKPVGPNGDISLEEITADDSMECSENVINRTLLKEDLDITFQSLNPQEREVMRLRFGLKGGRPKTLEEIGYVYNLTRERIRQIEVRAMRKLKTAEDTHDQCWSKHWEPGKSTLIKQGIYKLFEGNAAVLQTVKAVTSWGVARKEQSSSSSGRFSG